MDTTRSVQFEELSIDTSEERGRFVVEHTPTPRTKLDAFRRSEARLGERPGPPLEKTLETRDGIVHPVGARSDNLLRPFCAAPVLSIHIAMVHDAMSGSVHPEVGADPP